MAPGGEVDSVIRDIFGEGFLRYDDTLPAYDLALLPQFLGESETPYWGQQTSHLPPLQVLPSPTNNLLFEPLPRALPRAASQDGTLYPLLGTFLDCLHPSMPFFMRSYLINGMTERRHHSSRAFNALLHAICALTLLQPVKGNQSLRRDRAQWAEQLLAKATNLHAAHADFGEAPVLEHVMTSVFLFGCHFCRNTHNAAKVRLREAGALADVMGLYNPASYELVSAEEKDSRVRTVVLLTVIERIYALQRGHILYSHPLNGREIGRLLETAVQSAAAGNEADYKAVEGLQHMIDQVDFIDDSVLRCWKETCRRDPQHRHVPASTIRSLLKRYATPRPMHALLCESQLADIVITRHWVRHVLWNLGFRHGYLDATNPDPEMRPDHAMDIAQDAVVACEQFRGSLEVHGVGLAEKLYDIAVSAVSVAQPYYLPLTYYGSFPDQGSPREGEDRMVEPSRQLPPRPEVADPNMSGGRQRWTRAAVRRLLNKYLAILSLFRGGDHPFLRPYMQMLCALDGGGVETVQVL
ncbi:hypothetical protein C8A00DRAFT_18252 [Chaetomidium leptoderma]|uniref:Transcription factor domain-containing protein n=1 Tax=Chaetomidium leptoderma TaxID=669021 RepID=A0AAN6ZTC0_9PEZI|nr:hypothetical protein C8A00DRAFT_18252 [Chaetomidium leptoderma]